MICLTTEEYQQIQQTLKKLEDIIWLMNTF